MKKKEKRKRSKNSLMKERMGKGLKIGKNKNKKNGCKAYARKKY